MRYHVHNYVHVHNYTQWHQGSFDISHIAYSITSRDVNANHHYVHLSLAIYRYESNVPEPQERHRPLSSVPDCREFTDQHFPLQPSTSDGHCLWLCDYITYDGFVDKIHARRAAGVNLTS